MNQKTEDYKLFLEKVKIFKKDKNFEYYYNVINEYNHKVIFKNLNKINDCIVIQIEQLTSDFQMVSCQLIDLNDTILERQEIIKEKLDQIS